MKKTRLFLAASLLTIGAFSTITMTSCSKDDKICDVGYQGSDCDVMVRDSYNNTYRGTGSNSVGETYTNWALKFSSKGSAATGLQLEVLDNNNANQLLFDATLTTNTTYTITEKTDGAYTYTGNGTISSTNASLTLTEKNNTTGSVVTIVYTFSNMIKE